MRAIGRSIATGVLLTLTLATGGLAAPRQDDGKEPPRSREIRKSRKPPNPWIAIVVKILDWPSIPPG